MYTERTIVLHSTWKVQISTTFYSEPLPSSCSSLKHVSPSLKYKENHLQVPRSQHLLAAHQLVSIFQVHQSWRVFPDLPATGPNRNDRHQIHQEWCYKEEKHGSLLLFLEDLGLDIHTHFLLTYLQVDDNFALHHSRNYPFFCTKRLVIKWESFWWNSTIS